MCCAMPRPSDHAVGAVGRSCHGMSRRPQQPSPIGKFSAWSRAVHTTRCDLVLPHRTGLALVGTLVDVNDIRGLDSVGLLCGVAAAGVAVGAVSRGDQLQSFVAERFSCGHLSDDALCSALVHSCALARRVVCLLTGIGATFRLVAPDGVCRFRWQQ